MKPATALELVIAVPITHTHTLNLTVIGQIIHMGQTPLLWQPFSKSKIRNDLTIKKIKKKLHNASF